MLNITILKHFLLLYKYKSPMAKFYTYTIILYLREKKVHIYANNVKGLSKHLHAYTFK
jgi:hypothetical protein